MRWSEDDEMRSTAFEQGEKARQRGKGRHCNPYHPDDVGYYPWLRGWDWGDDKTYED